MKHFILFVNIHKIHNYAYNKTAGLLLNMSYFIKRSID